jgi:hypothetical protein
VGRRSGRRRAACAIACVDSGEVTNTNKMDDQDVALVVDVDDDLVGRLAGEDTPQRHVVARTAVAGHLHEPRRAAAAEREACRPPRSRDHLRDRSPDHHERGARVGTRGPAADLARTHGERHTETEQSAGDHVTGVEAREHEQVDRR